VFTINRLTATNKDKMQIMSRTVKEYYIGNYSARASKKSCQKHVSGSKTWKRQYL